MLRSIYGCIESVFLWYNIFSTTLEVLGFEINLYDRCVLENVIESIRCTIDLYVDGSKLSHKNIGVISDIIMK